MEPPSALAAGHSAPWILPRAQRRAGALSKRPGGVWYDVAGADQAPQDERGERLSYRDVEEGLDARRVIATYEAIRKLTRKHVTHHLGSTSPVRRVS